MTAPADLRQAKEPTERLVGAVRELADKRGAAETVKSLDEIVTRLRSGRLSVVVCGEFKQGKSTLLNALLRTPDLLPTDIDITTAVVTTLAWGEREKIEVLLDSGGPQAALPITRDALADYVTERNGVGKSAKVRIVEVNLPSPLLRDGLVLVDTPGIGGIAIEHSEVTFAFLPTADLILFVTSAQAPLSANEIDFIVQRLAPFDREIVVVLNRIDRQRSWQTILADDQAKLASALGRPPESITILPVSARNFLDYLNSHDPRDLADSRFEALENAILQRVTTHGVRLMLMRALEGARRALDELRAPLVTELEVCRADSAAAVDRLEIELKSKQHRIDELRESGARWRRDIFYGFQDIQRKARENHETGSAKLRTDLDQRLHSRVQLADPPRIGRDIAADLQTHRALMTHNIIAQVEALRLSIAQNSGIDLPGTSGQTQDYPSFDQAPDLKAALGEQGATRRAVTVTQSVVTTGRFAMMSTRAGGSVGAIFGALVGGGVGFLLAGVGAAPGAAIGAGLAGLLGSVVGLGTGIREGLEAVNAKDEATTRQRVQLLLLPFVNDSLARVRHFHDDLLVQLERAAIEEFEQEIVREQRISSEQVKALGEQRTLSRRDAAQRARELEALLKPLDRLQTDAGRRLESLRSGAAVEAEPPKMQAGGPEDWVEVVGATSGSARDIGLSEA